MFDDYPIIYETIIDNNIKIILLVLLIILTLLFYTIIIGKILKKAGIKSLRIYIPFLNIYELIRITNLERKNIVLFFIPIVNIYTFFKIAKNLSRRFNKNKKFSILLFIFPYIYYPVLALSNSKYIGINNEDIKDIGIDEDIIVKVEKKDKQKKVINNIPKENKDNKKITDKTDSDYIECPNCHNRIKKGISICYTCGANLKNIEKK